ncbi:hypothetical protein PG984_011668 [Apiospora sp. TS-2023a]
MPRVIKRTPATTTTFPAQPPPPATGKPTRARSSNRLSTQPPAPTAPAPDNGEEEHTGKEKDEQFPFNPKYDEPKPYIFPNLPRSEGQGQQDPTLTDPFAKPAKNAKGRTPLPSDDLVARRKAARLARQREEEQANDRDEEDQN